MPSINRPIADRVRGRILFAERNPADLQALEDILSLGGHEVFGAPSGQTIMTLAQEHPADLIILDIGLTDPDLLALCQALHQDCRTRDIPLVFTCPQQDTEARAIGFAAGCVDCLTKPFLADEVQQRVRTHLALSRRQHRLEAPVVTNKAEFPAARAQPVKTELKGAKGNAESRGAGNDIGQRLRFEQMLSDLSSRFIHLPPDQLDAEIERALQKVLKFFQVDRCGLLRVLPDKNTWRITHVASTAYAPPVPIGMELPRSINPWGYAKLTEKREVVSFARVDDMPAEAAVDKQTWREWSIRSNLTIPILSGGTVDHIISINSVRCERVWPEAFIPRLQMLGEIFVNALERRNAEQALRESEVRLSLAAAAAEAGLWVLHPHDGYIWATAKLRELLQLDPQEVLDFERFMAVVHPEDEVLVRDSVRQCLKTGELVSAEYRIRVPDGSARWIATRGRAYPANTEQPERVMGVTIDITARKALECRIQAQLEEIRQLKAQLEQENIYLRDEIKLQHGHGQVVGRSAAMKKVLGQVEQVAATDATVLLLGETGTGKELLARTIHSLSRRKARPLITINCAALPPTLIESELFGREKGAYTGALTRMPGRFEIAHRSTLFLDEIGELSFDLQSKLLRAIEEGRFERLGSTQPLKVDVRVIAATNRDLPRMVAEGKFRSDLYYRLNVFPISIPPLRERTKDIAPLVWAFVRQNEKKLNKRIDHIPRRDMEALQRYAWPGNARELRNCVEHAMITNSGGTLHFRPLDQPAAIPAAGTTLQDIERRHILEVLGKTGWRVTGIGGAAEILGLKRTTLQSRMKRLGIKRPTG